MQFLSAICKFFSASNRFFRCTILLIASGKNPLGEIGSQLLTCDQFNVLKQLKSLFLCIRQEDDNLIYIPLLSITNVLNLCRQSELGYVWNSKWWKVESISWLIVDCWLLVDCHSIFILVGWHSIWILSIYQEGEMVVDICSCIISYIIINQIDIVSHWYSRDDICHKHHKQHLWNIITTRITFHFVDVF